jgi:AcrR family transcriptional regulator
MAQSIWDDSIAGHKQRLREHILDTAADLIGEHGAADVPMALLARRAGIARATLYNYFPDFERVLSALVAHEVARLRTRLDRQPAGGDPVARLHQYLTVVYDWAARQRQPRSRTTPRVARRKLAPSAIAAMHEPLAELRQILAGILADGVAAGGFPPDIHPGLHADLIHKILLDPAQATTQTPPVIRDQVLRFIHRGLTVSPAPLPGGDTDGRE